MRIEPALRARILVEHGYGKRFGASDAQLGTILGGLRSREELLEESDIVLHPKPVQADLAVRPSRSVLWGWPHCVQDEAMTQVATRILPEFQQLAVGDRLPWGRTGTELTVGVLEPLRGRPRSPMRTCGPTVRTAIA
jgi:hypothetical protein